MSPSALGVVSSARVASAAPGGPFPTAGLIGWYDADDAASFTYFSGSLVRQWTDKSGAGWHATAVGDLVDNAPTVVSNAINGRPALDFKPRGGLVTTRPGGSAPPYHMFAAVMTGEAAGSGNTAVVGAAGSGGITLDHNMAQMRLMSMNSHVVGAAATSFPRYQAVTFSASQASDWSWAMYRNGAPDGAGMDPVKWFSNAAVHLGALVSPSTAPYLGLVGEFLFYDRVLTEPERLQVEAYLAAKWLPSTAWLNLFYDYWTQEDVVGLTWPSHKGLLPTLSLDPTKPTTPSGGVRPVDVSLPGAVSPTLHTLATVRENYQSTSGYVEAGITLDGGSGWTNVHKIGWHGSPPYPGGIGYFAPGLDIPVGGDMTFTPGQSILSGSSYDKALGRVTFALPGATGPSTVQYKTGWPAASPPTTLTFNALAPTPCYAHRFLGIASADLINSPDWLAVCAGVEQKFGAIT